MGDYLIPGHVYVDGSTVTGPNLTEHVEEAILKPTAISSQTLKDPAALSDEILINDGGTLKKITLQQIYAQMIQSGTVIQTVYSEYTPNTNLTAIIPLDDTVPQNTEGTEIISASITPRFSNSTILAQFRGAFASSVTCHGSAALFRDAVANAIASEAVVYFGGTDHLQPQYIESFTLTYMDSPATVSAVAYKIRVGPNAAATMRLNGSANSRYHGGAQRATLVLQEIKV